MNLTANLSIGSFSFRPNVHKVEEPPPIVESNDKFSQLTAVLQSAVTFEGHLKPAHVRKRSHYDFHVDPAAMQLIDVTLQRSKQRISSNIATILSFLDEVVTKLKPLQRSVWFNRIHSVSLLTTYSSASPSINATTKGDRD